MRKVMIDIRSKNSLKHCRQPPIKQNLKNKNRSKNQKFQNRKSKISYNKSKNNLKNRNFKNLKNKNKSEKSKNKNNENLKI